MIQVYHWFCLHLTNWVIPIGYPGIPIAEIRIPGYQLLISDNALIPPPSIDHTDIFRILIETNSRNFVNVNAVIVRSVTITWSESRATDCTNALES